ncbi:MAG: ethylbenzene dehydrogenase-related protein [Chitinophagaceae bacterium]|nr:ethylbenzene dehydrogenase-related protein [Chitinophagaceae bacterium]MDP1764170.1 ethylbenzene dehydrogenase-related protein [Sediminibacterium sp.]MDP1810915.1 ethylbenzene dehydrogenase-related protein [Sediminibacterium sp.]MDP3128968.1 ethylbenzene dehydrogenase-related protein [Sediminibacterium sp.]MDP3667134.1 ethylbenzene dehydrogenase-related protein [Sediminibacterium sp.]
MKLLQSKSFLVITIIILFLGYAISCTKNDRVLIVGEPTANNETELVSVKVTTAPTIDGVIDGMWENSPKLQFSTAVPDVTGDVFRGYTGNIIPTVTLRSAYDATNIYFLAEWMDPTQSLTRLPWYFDPATQLWAQESGAPTFSTKGAITRLAFYEDKVAMLWNINNSVSGWNNATCYKSCHTGLPAVDGSSRHFTNFGTEKIDMWHWKAVRGGTNGGFQFEDQNQINKYPNGRQGDPGNDVYTNNVQSLVITGSSPAVTVSVPKYVIPAKLNYGWILVSEITAGTAKTVTGVSATGVLTLSDATTIDPNVGTDYQRVGTGVGAKAIPGLTINSYTGSRGDITCKSTYTGSGWILEFKRALKTADAVYDIDFSSLADQYFGFAIFENAQIAHSIKPNLLLTFKK